MRFAWIAVVILFVVYVIVLAGPLSAWPWYLAGGLVAAALYGGWRLSRR